MRRRTCPELLHRELRHHAVDVGQERVLDHDGGKVPGRDADCRHEQRPVGHDQTKGQRSNDLARKVKRARRRVEI